MVIAHRASAVRGQRKGLNRICAHQWEGGVVKAISDETGVEGIKLSLKKCCISFVLVLSKFSTLVI